MHAYTPYKYTKTYVYTTQAGKTIGYVALGLGAAAALGAVAVDTAAVDAALASALMAAVIIGDDSKPRREKEEGKEGAEAEGDEAEVCVCMMRVVCKS